MPTTAIKTIADRPVLSSSGGAPTAVRIAAYQDSDAAAWRDFLNRHPDATLFHGLEWKQAVERTFGHRFCGLVAWRGDRIVGLLPLYQIRSMLAGVMLVSVPYATYGGIIADEPAAAAAIYQAAAGLCEKMRARTVELRSMRAAVPTLETRATHATFVRELPANPDDVAASLPRKARAAARRAAERGDLRCTFDGDALRTLWMLYSRSMRRLASPNYPLRFFEQLAEALPGRHVVQLVWAGGRPVAGLLSFIHQKTLMPYFAGVDERVDIYGLGHFMYAESMKWGCANGLRIYDFGRSRIDNRGPYEFKRLCGFEPTVLQYQVHIAEGQAAPDLSPTSSRWRAARGLWKKLPLALTRPLGGWLAKSIPG